MRLTGIQLGAAAEHGLERRKVELLENQLAQQQRDEQAKQIQTSANNVLDMFAKAVEKGSDENRPVLMQQLAQILPQFEESHKMAGLDPQALRFRAQAIEQMPTKAQLQAEEFAKPTEAQRNVSATGRKPGTPEFQQKLGEIISRPPTSVNISMNPESIVSAGEKKATETFGGKIAERANGRFDEAKSAQSQNLQLDRIKLALSRGIQTGMGQETILNLKSFASVVLGLPGTENMAEQELVRSISNEMALRLRNPESGLGLTGNTSNKDLEFLKASVVGLNRTQNGNIVLIDMMKRMNELKQSVADEQSRVIRNNRGVVPLDLDNKLLDFVNQYPFFSESERKQIESMTGVSSTTINKNRPSLDEIRAKHLR